MSETTFVEYYDKLLEKETEVLLQQINKKIAISIESLNSTFDTTDAYDELKSLINLIKEKNQKKINLLGKKRDQIKNIDSIKNQYIYLINQLLMISNIINSYNKSISINDNKLTNEYRIMLIKCYIETYKNLGIYTKLPKNDIMKLSKLVLNNIKNKLNEFESYISSSTVISKEYKNIINRLSLEYKIVLENIYFKLSKFNYVKFNYETANFYNIML